MLLEHLEKLLAEIKQRYEMAEMATLKYKALERKAKLLIKQRKEQERQQKTAHKYTHCYSFLNVKTERILTYSYLKVKGHEITNMQRIQLRYQQMKVWQHRYQKMVSP